MVKIEKTKKFLEKKALPEEASVGIENYKVWHSIRKFEDFTTLLHY